MDMRDYIGPSYIKYPDVVGGPRREKIRAVQDGNFDCKVLEFDSGDLFSLNRTNARTLVRAYGWESDKWIGKVVELYAGETTFEKQAQQSVLVKPISPPGPGNALNENDIPY